MAAITMAVLILQWSPAHACGYDAAMVDFAPAHPRSIEVALAVRDAFDRKEVRALPSIQPVLGFLRATRMVQDFRPLVSSLAPERNVTVAMLLVESGLWTRYLFTPQGAVAELHVEGSQPGEVVIITSEAVLRALLDGKLEMGRAVKLGVLIVVRPA